MSHHAPLTGKRHAEPGLAHPVQWPHVYAMQWDAVGLTDCGLRRPQNEDSFLCLQEPGVFAVADGMGGHAAGEVASGIAAAIVGAAAPTLPLTSGGRPLDRALVQMVRSANAAIRAHSLTEPTTSGMGTTLSVLALLPERGEYRVAHIGDSRVYRLRRDKLRQLTIDHTLVQQMVEDGDLTPEQARRHRLSNIVTRSLGIYEAVDADVVRGRVDPGDLFMLCSDGLNGLVRDEDIQAILTQPLALEVIASHLVEAANLRGGYDNITVVLVRIGDQD